MANAQFHLGSEGDNNEHMRDATGWPYSIYVRDDRIGGCDRVITHGIQSLKDAEYILSVLNACDFSNFSGGFRPFAN